MQLPDKGIPESDNGYDGPNSKHLSFIPSKDDISDDGCTDSELTPPPSPVPVHSSKGLSDKKSDFVVPIAGLNKSLLEAYTKMSENLTVDRVPPGDSQDSIKYSSDFEFARKEIDKDTTKTSREWAKQLVNGLQVYKKRQLKDQMKLSDSVAAQLVTSEKPKTEPEAIARAKCFFLWLDKIHEAITQGHFDDPNSAIRERVSEEDNIRHRESYRAKSEESLVALREKISQLETLNKEKIKIPEDSLKQYNAFRKELGGSRKQHNLRVTFRDESSLEEKHYDHKYNDPLGSMIDSQVQDKISQKQFSWDGIPGDITSEIQRLDQRYDSLVSKEKKSGDSRSVSARKSDCANFVLSRSEVFYDKKIREEMILFTRLYELVSDLCGVLALKGQPSYQQQLKEISHVQLSVVELSAFDRETAISKLYQLFLAIKDEPDLKNIFLECPSDFGDEETVQEKAYVNLLMRRLSKESIVSTPLLRFFSYYDLLNPEFDGLLNPTEIQKTLGEIDAWVLLMRDLGDLNQTQQESEFFNQIKEIQQKNISIPKKHAFLERVIERKKQATTEMKQADWFEKFKSQWGEKLSPVSGNVNNEAPKLCSASVKREIQGIYNERDYQQASQKYDRLQKSVEDRWCIVPSSCFQFLMVVSFVGIPYLYYSKYQEKQQDRKFINALSVSELVPNEVDNDISKEAQTIKTVDAFFANKRKSGDNETAIDSKKYKQPTVIV